MPPSRALHGKRVSGTGAGRLVVVSLSAEEQHGEGDEQEGTTGHIEQGGTGSAGGGQLYNRELDVVYLLRSCRREILCCIRARSVIPE